MTRAYPLNYYLFPEVMACFPRPTTAFRVRSSVRRPLMASRTKRQPLFSAKLYQEEEVDDDPFFRCAMERASLRHQETLRPDPLFLDPYIGCLLSPDFQMEIDMDHMQRKHCLTTKFIDDRLLETVNKTDGLRQVVLLTDGLDTRPYRLRWPVSTMIYDVSPAKIFRRSQQKLEDVGAKIPRSCSFLHVPYENSKFQQDLLSKGFNGARASVWVLQGLPVRTLADFKHILSAVSNLATKGSPFFGEMPIWLVESATELKSMTRIWVDKLFMSLGLRVEIIEHCRVAGKHEKESVEDEYKSILFVAEQLQYSDDEMEIWRREFQRIEEEGDEEGFEEL